MLLFEDLSIMYNSKQHGATILLDWGLADISKSPEIQPCILSCQVRNYSFQTLSLSYSLFFPECDFEHPSMKQMIDPIPRFKIIFFLCENFRNLGVTGLKKC
jgi:hypothetical protein